MFNKKEERIVSPNAMNQFGQGTVINGDVTTEGDIRIDGKITGTLTSKAKVVLGANGVVEGDIVCVNAYIDGRVSGNLEVSELLILSKSSHITGDLKIKKLVVEEGAKFNGKCSMGMSVNRNQSLDQPMAKPKATTAAL